MPTEAFSYPKGYSNLTHSGNEWWKNAYNEELPYPIVAGISHYQFATIHPCYDGNRRTSRLLTTLILYLGGFDLKGLYFPEKYYAKNLLDYYPAISRGPHLMARSLILYL